MAVKSKVNKQTNKKFNSEIAERINELLEAGMTYRPNGGVALPEGTDYECTLHDNIDIVEREEENDFYLLVEADVTSEEHGINKTLKIRVPEAVADMVEKEQSLEGVEAKFEVAKYNGIAFVRQTAFVLV